MSTKSDMIMSLAAGIASKLSSNVFAEDDKDVETVITQMKALFDKGEKIKPSSQETIGTYGIYSGD